MSARGASTSPIRFVYNYLRHGRARAAISDGNFTYNMEPSYVPIDPLFALMRAVVEVLRYGGDARCSWFYEPDIDSWFYESATDQWTLHREGDTLQITIRRVGGRHPGWPAEGGTVKFAALCDVWKFAAKIRLAASRMVPVHEQEHNYDPASVQRTGEYRALCAFLDEHKGTQHPRSGKRTR
jgi:hypothetical protein